MTQQENTGQSHRGAHSKRRTVNQIQGHEGEDLVCASFPRQWVSRKISSDFGIDLHVETFAWVDDDRRSADTLGEHFFVQVKSRARAHPHWLTIRERRNVSKYRVDPECGDAIKIRVISCELDVSEIITIESMGNAIPVLLCVAAMDTRTVYYVCMNDYISKVLLPNNPNYRKQKSVVVHVPAWNVLDANDRGIAYLWILARRAKLYSAFNTFNYQAREMEYARDSLEDLSEMVGDNRTVSIPDDIISMLEVFITSNLRLDIWRPLGEGGFFALQDLQRKFEELLNSLPSYRTPMNSHQIFLFTVGVCKLFTMAANMGRIFEELGRESHLPTVLAARLDDDPKGGYRPMVSE
ncbi:DUF4365 domain-containing protein [Nocardia takedensis]|uniref:DUF4365 domain-containing protein n=1 Tax=Nocardia takedensis TaxID=259390 RepID=UPI003F76526D